MPPLVSRFRERPPDTVMERRNRVDLHSPTDRSDGAMPRRRLRALWVH